MRMENLQRASPVQTQKGVDQEHCESVTATLVPAVVGPSHNADPPSLALWNGRHLITCD